jgi:glycosyltransferase involved in cell wall biosynthesis
VRAAKKHTTTFTIVSAVYNVERYLDDYIASIEGQKYPRTLIQVVAVDDGSTDKSLERLQRWQRESDLDIVVLTKENGGQGSARNLGMTHATGDWITFTDPDDTLAPAYFRAVASFLEQNPATDMVATRLMVLDDLTGQISNTHPLRTSFRDGDVARRLSAHGDFFAGSAPSALFRRDRLQALQLRFDDRVQPNFEDGHFCVRYLLSCDDPVLGFVRSAHYHYRRRHDGTSTLQRSMKDVRRFTDVLRYGYLDVIEQAVAKHGSVPLWLQHYLTYELSWYTSSGLLRGQATACTGEIADQYHAMAREILGHIDPHVLQTFSRRRLNQDTRVVLQHGYDESPWRAPTATILGIDRERDLAKLAYYYTGEAPTEVIEVSGRVIEPRFGKIRDLVLFDRIPVRQRVVWVPLDGTIHLTLDGADVPIEARERPPAATALLPHVVRAEWPDQLGGTRPLKPEEADLLHRAAGRRARRFRDAWVFIDRIHDADDSAEHLFHHVRAHHPEVNAWFVVEKDTADWKRLRRAGVKRLVAHGSEQWKLLMINARHLVSSHADVPIMRPTEVEFPGGRNWHFTFLQHGVIKDDLSGWLNPKQIDVFVTSTPAEYDSIAGDHNRYVFSPKEVVLSGLPRFDRLRAAGLGVPPEQRDLVLIVPTWRNWLSSGFVGADTQRRAEFGPEFFESDFVAQWLGLLRSPMLREASERHGLRIGFLPHPNLQSALPRLDLPAWIEPLSYEGTDVRQLFARAAVMVTDYSSVAFNAAYIDRPVVYFQFDAELVFGGEHVGQRGYFDYGRDGFGPVTETVEQTVKEIGVALDAGRAPQEPYASRIAATFPIRDGGCCERTFQAIVASTGKVTSQDLAMPDLTAQDAAAQTPS